MSLGSMGVSWVISNRGGQFPETSQDPSLILVLGFLKKS